MDSAEWQQHDNAAARRRLLHRWEKAVGDRERLWCLGELRELLEDQGEPTWPLDHLVDGGPAPPRRDQEATNWHAAAMAALQRPFPLDEEPSE
jgi:hypothetical protein